MLFKIEENIFSYAKWFAGFDIENEDVDVLEFLMEHSLPHENWAKF